MNEMWYINPRFTYLLANVFGRVLLWGPVGELTTLPRQIWAGEEISSPFPTPATTAAYGQLYATRETSLFAPLHVSENRLAAASQ